jgi:hypothetical protein
MSELTTVSSALQIPTAHLYPTAVCYTLTKLRHCSFVRSSWSSIAVAGEYSCTVAAKMSTLRWNGYTFFIVVLHRKCGCISGRLPAMTYYYTSSFSPTTLKPIILKFYLFIGRHFKSSDNRIDSSTTQQKSSVVQYLHYINNRRKNINWK